MYKTTGKKKTARSVLLFVCLAVLAAGSTAREQTIVLGESDDWMDLQGTDGVAFARGKRGFYDILLRDAEYTVGPDTDLLLHFDSQVPTDSSGRYTTISSKLRLISEISRFGGTAGVFTLQDGGLVLEPGPDAVFGPGKSWGDLSLEFWLYPVSLNEGEIILQWNGSRIVSGEPRFQELRAVVSRRRVRWVFENLFLSSTAGATSIELVGRRRLLPKQWNHHLLRFDAQTGMLEYLVNGQPEAVTYATPTGRETGEVYTAFTGTVARGTLMIGPALSGVIDELRVSESFVDAPMLETYRLSTGTATTRVFDLKHSSSELVRIDAEYATPGDTAVYFFYRLSNQLATRSSVSGAWTPFGPGTELSPAPEGRYLQLLIELLPDGTGMRSPTVSSIQIAYAPDLPPHPPAWVTATPADGEITVEWQPASEAGIAGYLVYYGTRPGQYFGADSTTGPSPIDAGTETSVTLSGLTNGRLYYVSVVSYDHAEPPHMSEFSEERAARPSVMYGDQ